MPLGSPGTPGTGGLIAAVHPEAVLVGRRWPASQPGCVIAPELAEAPAVPPRVHVVQEVDVAVGNAGHLDPELLVAAGPEVPGVASLPLRGRQVPAFIAVVVGGGLRRLRTGNEHERQHHAAAGDLEQAS